MSFAVAATMTISAAIVLVVGVALHAQAAEVAIGAMLACLAGGIGACVVEHRGKP